jgi:hypothetical protein
MNRREFLLLKPGPESRTAEISCERLYMRYLDSRIDGSTASFMQNLVDDLNNVAVLRLTDTDWLTSEELQQHIEPILASFRSRGGTIASK